MRDAMSLPRFLFVLSIWLCVALAEYVQIRSCDGLVSNGGNTGRALDVRLEQQQQVLMLNLLNDREDCGQAAPNFTAILELNLLGRHSVYQASNTSTCSKWSFHKGADIIHPLAYPTSFDIGSLPPWSTFDIRFQIDLTDKQEIECWEANITPALSKSTSSILTWAPRVLFVFILLIGLLRGYHERTISPVQGKDVSEISLPGVGDCLGYLQWAFLTGGLSLHYPGFLQPIVGKLSIFSLFVTGPLTHGKVYSGVADGIISINGTYGGTSGLEHMHQIVGAPSTVDTWVNMVIAILIIAVAVALFREAVALVAKIFRRRMVPSPQDPLSARLLSRILGLLRVVLSYFTLPLSALSFYQLSAPIKLPVWHRVSAAILVVSIVLAFIWLFRRLPSRAVGLLLHDTPKWYQEQNNRVGQPERLYVTIVVALALIRGAIIGGMEAFGVVQLSLLATSEVCLLFSIRWLRIHPWLCMSTFLPAIRLVITLLMICFVRGLVSNSTRSAIGYVVVSLHASMIVLGIFLPAVYHLIKLGCKAASGNFDDPTTRGQAHQLADFEAQPSRVGLIPLQMSADRPQSRPTNPPSASRANKKSPKLQSARVPDASSNQYYRQPRHSSIRMDSAGIKRPAISSTPSHERLASTSDGSSRASSAEVSRSALLASSRPLSSSGSGSPVDDDWCDTSSVPLGPRWHDYTYREGDAFYGGRPGIATTPEVAAQAATPKKQPSKGSTPNNTLSSLSGVASAMRRNVSALYTRPVEPRSQGFEVVRPPRALHTPDHGDDRVATAPQNEESV